MIILLRKKDTKENYKGNKYMPMSNLFFLNDENQMIKIRELLTNQILTFPNSIVIENIVTGFKNNRFLSVNSKLEKIKTLKNYKRNSNRCFFRLSIYYERFSNERR